jgi:hypothetical protein
LHRFCSWSYFPHARSSRGRYSIDVWTNYRPNFWVCRLTSFYNRCNQRLLTNLDLSGYLHFTLCDCSSVFYLPQRGSQKSEIWSWEAWKKHRLRLLN